MRASVGDTQVYVWASGYPQWFHIEQHGEKSLRVQFDLPDAKLIRDILSNFIEQVECENRKRDEERKAR